MDSELFGKAHKDMLRSLVSSPAFGGTLRGRRQMGRVVDDAVLVVVHWRREVASACPCAPHMVDIGATTELWAVRNVPAFFTLTIRAPTSTSLRSTNGAPQEQGYEF